MVGPRSDPPRGDPVRGQDADPAPPPRWRSGWLDLRNRVFCSPRLQTWGPGFHWSGGASECAASAARKSRTIGPMSGVPAPEHLAHDRVRDHTALMADSQSLVGEANFGFCLLAMGSGRPRTADELKAMLRASGFARVREVRTRRPLLIPVLVAVP